MKTTRIIESKNLNQGKYNHLLKQAERLGKIRSMVWDSYGSINKGVLLTSDRTIRDQWIKEKRRFNALANAWKEILRDSFGVVLTLKSYDPANSDSVNWKR